MKNEVIVQRTHRVNYDHAIRNAGVKMVEVVTREQMETGHRRQDRDDVLLQLRRSPG